MLSGWKAIAGYLHRDERTAMRWAGERGMPVHRTPGRGRGTVYALPEELDTWFVANRELAAEAKRSAPPQSAIQPAQPAPRRWLIGALIMGGILLAGIGVFTLNHSMRARASTPPAFTDPQAKALYLQANYDWNLRTPASLIRARQEFSDAIGRDPGVPASYVGLANTYLLLREFGTMPEAEAYGRAEAAAKTAVSLDPDSAEAHRALGFIAFWWRQDRATARQEFRRAIELKPDDPLTHHWYATALHANGEFAAALREIGAAQDLDPTGTATLADRGVILYTAGRRAEGVEALRALTREQPDAIGPHRQLAGIALSERRLDEFLHEAQITAQLRGDAASLADVKRWSALSPDIDRVVAAMLADAQAAHAGAYRLAQLNALAGRKDEALNALASACRGHGSDTSGALADLMLLYALSRAEIAQRCNNRPLLA